MKVLFILNEGPYTSEKSYNALRLAIQMQKDLPQSRVSLYFLADATLCALAGQSPRSGAFSIEQMVKEIMENKGMVKACTSCGQTRGLSSDRLLEGVSFTNLSELVEWTTQADKVLTF